MSWDVVAEDTYSCPSCREWLHALPHGRNGWVRCPSCGRPSFPPDQAVFHSLRPLRPSYARADLAPLVITDTGEPAAAPDQPPSNRFGYFTPARLVFITGLALCLVMALFAFVDGRTTNLGIFGFLAVVFFVLMLRTHGRRAAEP